MAEQATRIVRFVAGLGCAHVVLYFVLMSRTPSVDESGRLAYMSTFRLAPSVRAHGPNTIFVGRACFLNSVFYPMDWIYWQVADRNQWVQFQAMKEELPEETTWVDRRPPAEQ